jgi:hypothetical protein
MRAPLALLVAVGALLLASQVAVGTSVAAPPDTTHASVELELKASNGLSARLEGEGDRVELTVLGRRQSVSYTVRGSVTEAGIEARFGKLGRISVEFRPTRTLETTKPSPECEGPPWSTKAGFFSGVIEFAGERGYVRIDSARARGKLRVNPDWKCDYRRRAAARRDLGEIRAREEEGDVATLDAYASQRSRFFRAFAVRDPKYRDYTYFYGGTVQRRQGVRIVRAAFASARSASFAFDHERGTAAISPPWPFRGSATFGRARSGANAWTGSLSVPLLGAAPVALTGARFDAKLVRSFPSE